VLHASLIVEIIHSFYFFPSGFQWIFVLPHLIVVKPALPFLDWLHRVDSTSAHLTLEDLSLDPTIYLLPKSDNNEEALEHLRKVSGKIFEEQLNGWYRVPSVCQRSDVRPH
jgi:hypothetical protein